MEANDKAIQIKAAFSAAIAFGTALFGWVGWVIILWLAAMVLDYLTGSFAAIYMGQWTSREASRGLWHKLGSIAAVSVSHWVLLPTISAMRSSTLTTAAS